MDSDHEAALALAKFLDTLNNSSVPKYRYFFNQRKDPNCKYTQKSLLLFKRDKERILQELRELADLLIKV